MATNGVSSSQGSFWPSLSNKANLGIICGFVIALLGYIGATYLIQGEIALKVQQISICVGAVIFIVSLWSKIDEYISKRPDPNLPISPINKVPQNSIKPVHVPQNSIKPVHTHSSASSSSQQLLPHSPTHPSISSSTQQLSPSVPSGSPSLQPVNPPINEMPDDVTKTDKEYTLNSSFIQPSLKEDKNDTPFIREIKKVRASLTLEKIQKLYSRAIETDDDEAFNLLLEQDQKILKSVIYAIVKKGKTRIFNLICESFSNSLKEDFSVIFEQIFYIHKDNPFQLLECFKIFLNTFPEQLRSVMRTSGDQKFDKIIQQIKELDKNAEPNDELKQEFIRLIIFLIDRFDFKKAHIDILVLGMQCRSIPLIDIYINTGGDFLCTDIQKNTLVHKSILEWHELFFYLVKRFERLFRPGDSRGYFSINFPNTDGDTPLHLVCRNILVNENYFKMAKLLIDIYDADAQIKNNAGLSPIQILTSQYASANNVVRGRIEQIFNLLHSKKGIAIPIKYEEQEEVGGKAPIDASTYVSKIRVALSTKRYATAESDIKKLKYFDFYSESPASKLFNELLAETSSLPADSPQRQELEKLVNILTEISIGSSSSGTALSSSSSSSLSALASTTLPSSTTAISSSSPSSSSLASVATSPSSTTIAVSSSSPSSSSLASVATSPSSTTIAVSSSSPSSSSLASVSTPPSSTTIAVSSSSPSSSSLASVSTSPSSTTIAVSSSSPSSSATPSGPAVDPNMTIGDLKRQVAATHKVDASYITIYYIAGQKLSDDRLLSSLDKNLLQVSIRPADLSNVTIGPTLTGPSTAPLHTGSRSSSSSSSG